MTGGLPMLGWHDALAIFVGSVRDPQHLCWCRRWHPVSPDAQISIVLDADEPAAIAEKGNAAKGRSGPILNYPPAGRTAAKKIRATCLSSDPKSSQQWYQTTPKSLTQTSQKGKKPFGDRCTEGFKRRPPGFADFNRVRRGYGTVNWSVVPRGAN